jgi:hypothetical protein
MSTASLGNQHFPVAFVHYLPIAGLLRVKTGSVSRMPPIAVFPSVLPFLFIAAIRCQPARRGSVYSLSDG